MNRKNSWPVLLFLFISIPLSYSQTFTDVSASAGTAFNHDAPPNPAYMKFGTGAAWFDFNRDGNLDFFVSNRRTANKLFRNNGNGTFTDVAAAMGVDDPTGDGAGVVIGDINNDGYPDIYLANGDFDKLYKNNDGISFTDITTSAGLNATGDSRGTSASFGDYDEDGYLDLYVAHHQPIPGSISATKKDFLFYNNGDETFTDVSSLFNVNDLSDANFIAGWTDFDKDNDIDIIVVSDCPFGTSLNLGTRVFRNDGGSDPINNWTFTEVSDTVLDDCTHGMGVGIGDLNRDGWMDVTYSDIGPALLFQNNSGVFSDISGSAGINIQPADDYSWGVSFLDYNNDGWQDIVMAVGSMEPNNLEKQPNYLFRNNGDNTFTDEAFAMGVDDSLRTRTIVHGDYDNDGDLDLVLVNYDSTVSLYRNDIVTTENYIRILPYGTWSNFDALGAKVRIKTPDGVNQYFEMRSGSNLGGGDEICAHFGIGSNTMVDTIEVTWLSGAKDFLYNQSSNQTVTIVEANQLPIELTEFSGKRINRAVHLYWKTATEINNDYFEVQRSKDGRKFVNIGKVVGQGNSLESQDYSFIDHEPFPGINYYRLKQVDFDRSHSFSEVINFTIDQDQDYIKVYPNPARSNTLFLDLKLHTESETMIELFDLGGRKVHQESVFPYSGELHKISIPIDSQANGIYYLTVTNSNTMMSKKVVINR